MLSLLELDGELLAAILNSLQAIRDDELAEHRARMRALNIAHAGRWDEIMAPRVLALLHAELLGAHAFRPRVDTVLDFGNEQALLDEAARERTAPLTPRPGFGWSEAPRRRPARV